jgi:hypothetical protein
MSEWKDAEQLGTPSMHRIANSIEKIQRDLGHFSSGFRHLKADVYTQDDRDKENEMRRRRHDDDLQSQS